MTTMVVETRELTKRYGSVVALDHCNLSISSGQVLGILGPNGAGKTTLLRLLLGFISPTSGSAWIAGLDCHRRSVAVRRKLVYLPAESRMFPAMRGRDVLRFFAEIRPEGDLSEGRRLAERLELDLARRVLFMSTGMRRKLALSAALSVRAPLIILDEPTESLDPSVRGVIAEEVQRLRAEGRTILFSSHVLPEVEELCDRVVILRKGQIVHTQAMSELRRQHRVRARLTGPPPPIPETLKERMTVLKMDDELVLETPDQLRDVLRWIASLPVEEVDVQPIGLRAVYDRYHREGGLT